MEANPLVSIIVLTYNSGKFIIETLKSIEGQTYPKIELIITDDASLDNTIAICSEWIEKKQERFNEVQIARSEKNTGIAGNANRGAEKAHGSWLKFIAGDDILIDNCIEVNVNASLELSSHFIFSDEITFINSENNREELIQHSREFMSKTAREQFLNIITRNAVIKAPTSFIYRDTFFQLGCFDENYPMLEDYPLWIKATKKGFALRSTNVPTVKQRIHDHSVWNQFLNSSETPVNTQYIQDLSGLIRKVYLPELFANRLFLIYFSLKFELAAFDTNQVLKKRTLNIISLLFKLVNRTSNRIVKAIHG